MNADLEATLNELGPGYRAVVDRMLEPFASDVPVEKATDEAVRSPGRRPFMFPWLVGGLVAASLAVVFGFMVVNSLRTTEGRIGEDRPVAVGRAEIGSPWILAYSGTQSAIAEMLRTQGADGSWSSDALTRQNAAALRHVESAGIAYRRAVRYLRTRGLVPLTDEELRRRSVRAEGLMARL